jgi:hypothetical protein
MITSALILISVGCFLMLDWSLKERPIVGHSRLFFKRNQWGRISNKGYNNKENRSA